MPVNNVRVNAVTDNSANLAWDAVNGANGYNVYRCNSENGTYTKVNHSTISSAEYTDTGLNPLTEYYYKVSATVFELEGILSSPVLCTTLMPAPDNVRVTSVTDGSISFTWNAVNGASAYNIYRSGSVDGVYTKVNSSVVTQVSYADTELSSNTNYHYKVSAVTNSIESAQSSVLSVATLLPVPGNLRITTVTDISVSLEWDALSGASGYNVYRSASEDGAYAKINPFVIIAVSYTNTGISPETNYYYKICAVSSEGVEGVRSNAVSVATPISAPDNLRVTSVTDNSISLTWNTVSNASGYNLYRSSSVNGTYTKINPSLIPNVTYVDTGIVSNTDYYYKVSVVVDGVESIHSNAISGATLLPAPGNLRVIAITDVSVNLEWNTVNGASGYNVYRSGSENGSYTRINSSMITAVSYANTGVSPHTNYYYRVYAVSSGGIEGIPSVAVSCTTLMSAPENVRVTFVTDSSINLAWNTANGASGYNVYRSSGASGTYTKLNPSLIFDVSYTNTGLSSNTNYYYKVSAVAGDVEGVLSGAISGTTLLLAPGNLRVTSVTDNSITLEWNALTGANGYNIYRSASGNGTYTKVNSSIITTTSYTNTSVSSNTNYYYRVYAVSSGGIEGIPSTAVSCTTLMSAPGNLRVTSVTDSSINLAWNTITGASGYNIYRSSSVSGSYSKLNPSLISNVSYADTGLSSDTNYYYKVSAVANDVEGVLSSAISGTTLLPAPVNVWVTSVTDNSVSLEWNTVTGANGYNIYRSASENSAYAKVNSSVITAASFTNTGVSSNTTYYYRVYAVSSGGIEGLPSTAVSCTTLRAAPGNLRVTSVTDNDINLAWNTVNGVSGYNIYRSSSANGSYSKLNSSVISAASYFDMGLSSNTNYYYKVSVVVDDIEGVLSSAVSGTTLLSAPDNLRIIAVTDVSVNLEWNALTEANGYNIYRSTSENGTYTKVNSSIITTVAYTNTGASSNTTYYYRVCAVSSGSVEGVRSAAISGTTRRSAPGNLRVTSATDESINLAWNTVTGASGYNIYRSDSTNGTYTILNSSLISALSYTDTGLSSNASYYYKVSVVVDDVESVLSSAVSGTTLLIAPDNLRVTAVTDVSVSLEWNALTGANGYNIYRSTSENGTYTKVNSSIISAVSYTNTGLSSNTTYYYRICAVASGSVEGVRSNAISHTTLMSAPGNFRAASATDSSVSLTWNTVNGAGGYNIYRSIIQNGTYTKLNTSIITTNSYTNTGLASNTNYYYKVSAVSSGGIEGVQSGAISGTTLLVAPGGLNVTAITDVTISLEWNSLIGANGYNIYRSVSENGTYTKVNTSVITVLSYTNTGVSPDTTYYYRVCAVSTGGLEGMQSSAVSAVTLMPAPGNMQVFSVTDTSITLAWNVVNGANGYNIYRSSSADGIYTKLNTGALIVNEYTDTGFIPYSTIYYYKAKAVFSGGIEGAWSEPCSVMVPGNGLAAKLAWLQSNAISNNYYIIEVDKDENIGPQTLSYSGKSNITIILRGDGVMRTVNLSSSGRLFLVNSGVTLILDNNITLKGRASNNNFLVYIDNGGTLVMNNEVKIIDNKTSSSPGGGVRVYGGSFTMNGGEISGNTAASGSITTGSGVYVNSGTFTMHGGKISGNTASGSITTGSGVYVSSGTFTMYGGEISGNTASGSIATGSGVYVNSGTFTMHSGEISGNTASDLGGGVYMSSGTFTMYGGEISDNRAGVSVGSGTFTMEDGKISGNTGRGVSVGTGTFTMEDGKISDNTGSGVFIESDSSRRTGTFTMNDGEISGNSGGGVSVYYGSFTMNDGEISDNTTSGGGGGVSVYYSSFTMNGGTISGNTTNSNAAYSGGGGVYVREGTFTMNGGTISNNTASYTSALYFGGGGVYVREGTFTMNNGEISGNTSTTYGGGVYIYGSSSSSRGTFRMGGGVIYGSNAVEELQNTATTSGMALYLGGYTTAEYGTFSGTSFTKQGNLTTTDTTIRIVNGNLQTN
jgi:fibronectin type 3 domain-containing protein